MYIYYGSYVLVFGIALPCLNNSLQSLYSLVLGNGRQGTMQGVNQAVGSLSRILGPLVMSSTFAKFGPQATWGVEIGTLVLFLVIWAAAYKRLVPASQRPCKVVFEAKTGEPEKVFVVDLNRWQLMDDGKEGNNQQEDVNLEKHAMP
uniref:Uncharacterized protein n=1 Tax=Ditylenchus dipsaci TaxID=166011 RepID=A0A915CMC9_9BILA